MYCTATLAVVSLSNPPTLCRSDEVGELCIAATISSTSFASSSAANSTLASTTPSTPLLAHSSLLLPTSAPPSAAVNPFTAAATASAPTAGGSGSGCGYWGLTGLTNSTFKVQPLGADGCPILGANGESYFVRSGLLGFIAPVCKLCTLTLDTKH